jgi:hypothetical protein
MTGVLRVWLIALALVGTLALGACSKETSAGKGAATAPAGGVGVDLVYLNHEPVQPVLTDLDKVFTKYTGRIQVARHDVGTSEGGAFAKKHNLVGHVMIAVLIDGKVDADVSGRQIRFEGFPAGRSPMKAAEGTWKLDDLDAALKQRVGG